MRAFQAAQSVCWAITPEGLEQILTIANRESTDAMLAAALERRDARLQAVAAQDGRPLDGTSLITMRDGVAVLNITGPIVRYADLFSEISGATSVQALARDFTRALGDPGVSAILLNVDSPGGEVSGIEEFAAMVHAARATKPIAAYVSDLGASAAYWIASAADEIVVARTALVGSIGVVAAVRDPSKTTAKEIEFVSSQSPKKRADPTTESGKAQIQTIVDDLATIFVDAVATHRGVSADTVLADFGQGGVFVGQQAVAAGLVDRVGTFEQTLVDLHEQVRMARDSYPVSSASSQTSRATWVRAEIIKEPSMASLMERFWSKFGQMDEAEASDQALDAAIVVATASQPGKKIVLDAGETTYLTGTLETTDSPDVAALRAELAKARAEGITTAAAAFADMVIGANRAYPAERGALMDAYAQAAMDDASTPLATPRTALLKATVDARPAHHLTEELIPAGQTVEVLGNLQVTEDANTPMSDKRRGDLLKLSPVGRATLNKN